MSGPTKIRALAHPGGWVEVRMLMNHVMETGQRMDDSGRLIAEHFITEMKVMHGERTVLSAQWGPGVSKNPFLQFRFQGGQKGDAMTVYWRDNRGQSRSDTGVVE
ncbi:MAG TPA: thiosulfate oxidation carrier complex protein SoxZ [Burkholderiaceae bacterium]|nr:thiosulfate oxidation carrier complex protein SoxZ [Burkholderiaceae bacterium]